MMLGIHQLAGDELDVDEIVAGVGRLLVIGFRWNRYGFETVTGVLKYWDRRIDEVTIAVDESYADAHLMPPGYPQRPADFVCLRRDVRVIAP